MICGWRTLKKNKKKHIKIPKLKDDPNSQDMKVFVGLPIIAKVNFKKYDIVNAEKFDVIKIDFEKSIIIIKNEFNEIEIPSNEFNQLFYPSFCTTTHKIQGGTINEPISIYEWSKMGNDKRLKYTAVTRITKIEHLNFIL